MQENLYDKEFVQQWTDMPILVRMDTLKYLKAADVFGGGPAELKQTIILKEGEKAPPPGEQSDKNIVPEKMRQEWGDYVWFDTKTNKPQMLTRDDVGKNSKIGEAKLEGAVDVTLADGSVIRCRPVFDLVKEYAAHFDAQNGRRTDVGTGVGRSRTLPAILQRISARRFLRSGWVRTSSLTT